jgi:hypothetical protein
LADWTVGTPIVTYWGGYAEYDGQQAADGGYNLIQARTIAEVQQAADHGLRATLRHNYHLDLATWDHPAKIGGLNALIDQFKAMPNAYAYHIVDEPSAANFERIAGLVAHLKARDPARMAYVNLFPTYASNGQLGTNGYSEYLNTFVNTVQPDLISYDHYQFLTQGDRPDYFQNMAMVRTVAQTARVPFLNIVQAVAWEPGVFERPTPNQLGYLVNTTLAYGAQGISYFNDRPQAAYPESGGLFVNGVPTDIYHALVPLNERFVAVAGELQPFNSIGAYHLGDQPPGTLRLPGDSPFTLSPVDMADTTFVDWQPVKGWLLGLFGDGNSTTDSQFAYLVNLDYSTAKTTTVFGPEELAIFDSLSGTWLLTGANQIELTIEAGGGKLIGLASAVFVPEPSTTALVFTAAAGLLGFWRRARHRS